MTSSQQYDAIVIGVGGVLAHPALAESLNNLFMAMDNYYSEVSPALDCLPPFQGLGFSRAALFLGIY
jgi:hypothetical protein